MYNSSEEEEIFSFGYQLYTKITGKHPYTRPNIFYALAEPKPENPYKINKNIPKELGEIVMKMISTDINKRYSVFSEIEIDLQKVFS